MWHYFFMENLGENNEQQATSRNRVLGHLANLGAGVLGGSSAFGAMELVSDAPVSSILPVSIAVGTFFTLYWEMRDRVHRAPK